MLPQFVRERVKEGVRYIAESQGDVTIVFCDICDFEGICKNYKPAELTSFLDKLFSSFDNHCQTTGVAKIETVGKTYMACAGLKDSEKEMPQQLRSVCSSRRAVELAFAMIEEVKQIQLKNGQFLHVKIGINSGPVSAGVVGYHKPQFSLVGDTVNTASRMCSTLDTPNCIQISSSTYEEVKDCTGYEFQSKIVNAKGKGDIAAYIINERRQQDNEISALTASVYNFDDHFASGIITDLHVDELRTNLPVRTVTTSSIRWKSDLILKKNIDLIKYTPFFKLLCWETQKEKNFRLANLDKNYYSVVLSLLIAVISFTLLLVTTILQYIATDVYQNVSIAIIRSILVLCLTLLTAFHGRLYKGIYFRILLLVSIGLLHTVPMLNLSYRSDLPPDLVGLEVFYAILLLYHCSECSILLILIVNIGLFVPWIFLAVPSTHSAVQLTNIILAAAFSLVNLRNIYSHEKNDRTNHNLDLLAKKEIKENETLLVQLMPPRALEYLIKEQKFTDKLHKETLIFADIVGFTEWCSGKTPDEVVEMLSNLFTRFDKLCVEFDVYKVHTIGDCYVVMGDSWKLNRDYSLECVNSMKMAYKMIEVINEENMRNGTKLNMRIGVHTGEVIAGVIGTNIVRYDVWGPDVLIANKMESNGMKGRIKISEDTKELLQSRVRSGFIFEESEQVEVKSIGVIKNTYYVTCPDINLIEMN